MCLPITSILRASGYFVESYSCGLRLCWSESHLWLWNIPKWVAFMLVRWPIWSWCFQCILNLQFAKYVKSILWCYELHSVMKFCISFSMTVHIRIGTRKYASNYQIGSHTLNGRPNVIVSCFKSSRDYQLTNCRIA